MVKLPDLKEMLKAGVHFGHRTSRWHPNMEPYIFTERSGVHILNLEKTQKKMEEAGEFLRNLGMNGGTLFFVGTKKQAQKLIAEKAEECEMPYVVERWVGGILTNFFTIRKRVKHYMNLVKKSETGELKKYTKKEQHDFGKQVEDLRRKVGGLVKLEKMPDAIFILDLKTEKTALREALRKNIPVVAVCDTNVNPEGIKYPIPANDDSIKSIEIMISYVADSFKEGKAEQGKQIAEKKEQNEEKKQDERPVGDAERRPEKESKPKDEK